MPNFCVFKVKAGSAYHSCCVVVKNMQRCVYAVPKVSIFDKKALDGRDTSDSQNSEATLRATLQVNLHIYRTLPMDMKIISFLLH